MCTGHLQDFSPGNLMKSLYLLPHQQVLEECEEIERDASVEQPTLHDPSSLFDKVLSHCLPLAKHSYKRQDMIHV